MLRDVHVFNRGPAAGILAIKTSKPVTVSNLTSCWAGDVTNYVCTLNIREYLNLTVECVTPLIPIDVRAATE